MREKVGDCGERERIESKSESRFWICRVGNLFPCLSLYLEILYNYLVKLHKNIYLSIYNYLLHKILH